MEIQELLNEVTKDNSLINVKCDGNLHTIVDGLNLIGRETNHNSLLCYVTGAQYRKNVEDEVRIKALIVAKEFVKEYEEIIADRNGCLLITEKPEKMFYDIHESLCKLNSFYKPIVNKRVISNTAIIKPTAVIEDNVIIEDNVWIGDFAIIKSGTIIRHDTSIGNYTIIGADGYQVLRIDDIPKKITHCGGVEIGPYVDIGDHSTVCNTIFDGFTRIGAFTKINHYCQIAHYSNIGKNVILAPNVTIVGSVTVEDNVYIGAGATVMNKVVVKTGATIGIGSVVLTNVKAGTTVFGNPAKVISKM